MRTILLFVICFSSSVLSQDAYPLSDRAMTKIIEKEQLNQTTSSDAFKAFAMANHGIGSFHAAIGTMSLILTASTLTTIFVTAANDSWKDYHTIGVINALGMVVISTWEIGAGVKLRRAAGQYVFPKKQPVIEY